jgi:hypothetical protein
MSELQRTIPALAQDSRHRATDSSKSDQSDPAGRASLRSTVSGRSRCPF